MPAPNSIDRRSVAADLGPRRRPPDSGRPAPVAVRRITHELVGGVTGCHRALVTATEPGVAAGIELLDARDAPDPAGLWRPLRHDGEHCAAGDPLVEVTGTAWEIAVAGDHVLGVLGVAGGLARRAITLRDAAPASLGIACGGWKKWPATMKPVLRAALDVAGITHRLVDGEFVYIDKNLVRLLGGLGASIERGRALAHGPVAVQVVSVDEALTAASSGAEIVMVDTGHLDDLAAVHDALLARGVRGDVRVAFGGGVTEESLTVARRLGADIVDIGRSILDAPLWDLHLEVVA